MSEGRMESNLVSITVSLRKDIHEKLKEAAKSSGRSKKVEAMLRLTQHLNTVQNLGEDCYWEILLKHD